MEEAEGMASFVSQSENRFREATVENENLILLGQAQGDIIADLADSIVNLDEVTEKIAQVEKDIASIDVKLSGSQELLLEMLTSPDESAREAKPGRVLQSILSNTIEVMNGYCKNAVENGQISVSLLQVLDIEDQISKLICDMEDRNLYPESEQQLQQRHQRIEAHNQKIVGFLELIKSAAQKEQE